MTVHHSSCYFFYFAGTPARPVRQPGPRAGAAGAKRGEGDTGGRQMEKDLFDAMRTRKSTRAFLKRPVSRSDINKLFECAALAPSAINLQPWEFVVTYGQEKDRLVRRLEKARRERSVSCGPGTRRPLPDQFSRRSREALRVMAPHIGKLSPDFNTFVEQGSCAFYGAPVAVIVTIDKLFPAIRYLDLGISVAYFLLAAQALGLGTCPIGLICAYADEIADVLEIPDEKTVVLGIALGYPDAASPANQFKTGRTDLSEIVTWYE